MANKYEVGAIEFSTVDESRDEVLGDAQGKRKIPIKVFYPVKPAAVSTMKKSPYLSERKAEAIRKAFKLPKKIFAYNEADYYMDAPVIDGEKFPLLMFSPGYNSFNEANTQLCIDIVVKGYIVAVVGHANEAVANEYEDGSIDYYDKNISKLMYTNGPIKGMMALRKILKAQDVSPKKAYAAFLKYQEEETPFMLERIEQWRADMLCGLYAVKEKIGNYIDTSNGVAASGHSFGGATAYYLCQTCEEFTCGLNIDGALFGNYKDMIMTKPFYQIACKENANVESRVLLERRAPVYSATYSNMKHIGFTDIKRYTKLKLLVGSMDFYVMHNHLLAAHVSFLDKYLKEKTTSVAKSECDDIEIKEYI